MATEGNRKDKKKILKEIDRCSAKVTGVTIWRKCQGLDAKEGGYISKPGRQGKVYRSHHSISGESGPETEHGLCILLMEFAHGHLGQCPP